jgi:serine O-acetyltransferase
MFDQLRRDAARYAQLGETWYRHPGFWVGAVFRMGAWARTLPRVLRIPVALSYRILKLPVRIAFNVEIPASARVGPGLCLVHPSNIVVGPGVEIGEDCTLFHEVTIGSGMTPGFPRIGNKVHLFVGTRVLGPVAVGDGSMVGANCVVTRNVPPGSVVAPAPARVIPVALFERSSELVAAEVHGPPAPAARS